MAGATDIDGTTGAPLIERNDAVLRILADLDFDPARATIVDVETRLRNVFGIPPTANAQDAFVSSILAELIDDRAPIASPALDDSDPIAHPHVATRRLEVAIARGTGYLAATSPVADPCLWRDGWARGVTLGKSLAAYLAGVATAPAHDPVDLMLLTPAGELGRIMQSRLPVECDVDAPPMPARPAGWMVDAPPCGDRKDGEPSATSIDASYERMRRAVASRRILVDAARASWLLGATLIAHCERLSPAGTNGAIRN